MLTGKLANERELLLRVADGDEPSFIVIFDHYQPNIYHTAQRLTGDQWVAEEIVHDVSGNTKRPAQINEPASLF